MVTELKEIDAHHIADLRRRGLSAEATILLRKRNEWLVQERKKGRNEEANKMIKKRNFKLKVKGICVTCAKAPRMEGNAQYCKRCRDKHRAWARKKAYIQRLKQLQIESEAQALAFIKEIWKGELK